LKKSDSDRPNHLTNQVEKIFGKKDAPSKSDRDEIRDSRNRL